MGSATVVGYDGRAGHQQIPALPVVAGDDAIRQSCVQVVDRYPVSVFVIHGDSSEVIATATELVGTWSDICRDAASANLVATREESDLPFTLYFAPRHKHFACSPGFSGEMGGLEILGEIVFSSEEEKRGLDGGKIDAAYVRRLLACVDPPQVSELIERAR